MHATDSAPVASPSEGHRGSAREQQHGSDGAEISEGHPKGEERRGPAAHVFFDPYRFDSRTGAERLGEFLRAPAVVQQRFWLTLRRWTEKENAMGVSIFNLHGISTRAGNPELRWDDHWRTRAYNQRLREERGTRDNGFDAADAEDLKAIDAREYVLELTGEEPNRAGFIRCPLPGHEERTGSFHVRGSGWRCYGCSEHGTIYDLAAALWDLPMRGTGFLELHKRLMERFG